jgi:hypothetical protein
MQNGYLTIFCRKFFTVTDVSTVETWSEHRYDDGFTAYLNGSKVTSRNVTGEAFDRPASTAIEPTSEDIDITAFKGLLVNGTEPPRDPGPQLRHRQFGPELRSEARQPQDDPPSSSSHAPLVINEGFLRTGSPASRFIELHNMEPTPSIWAATT